MSEALVDTIRKEARDFAELRERFTKLQQEYRHLYADREELLDKYRRLEEAQIGGGSDKLANSITYCASFLTAACHGAAKEGGWWTDMITGEPLKRNFGELIALSHSELSEALEGFRKGLNDEHLPGFRNVEVELADTLIRVFDIAGGFKLRVAEAMAAKMQYNRERADHKPENRLKAGGKKF